MTLFPEMTVPAPYRVKALCELRRLGRELDLASERADALRRAASGHPDLELKVTAAEVQVAALRARMAQLRRAAGALARAA